MNKRFSIKEIIKQKVVGTVGINNKTTRETWLESTLKKIDSESRILDAGAGELQYKKFCSHLNYVSQDFGKYDGDGNNKGLQVGNWDNSKLDIVSDITAIPEPDKSFDAIMCIEVFEHLPNPIAAIKEFSRLIKDEGFLIITAPFCSLTHFAPYHFYTGFNRYFYEKYLAENNFEIIEMTPNGNYFEYVAQELIRIPDCANKYSNTKISIFNKFLILKILLMLKKLSARDKGSDELLCFGLHILAKKRIN
jgi:ubiquinone/menaquinone biosynthesis C-methylase UbiE